MILLIDHWLGLQSFRSKSFAKSRRGCSMLKSFITSGGMLSRPDALPRVILDVAFLSLSIVKGPEGYWRFSMMVLIFM